MLIEDYPGVGKTALARALARSVDAEYARVQCTADLLPADVVGTNVFNQREARFEFRPGPGVRERRARRRDQPGVAEDAVGPARVHAGAPRDGRQAHPRAGAAVHRARHPEPDRVRGHLSAARGAARPLHGARLARLSRAPTQETDMLADARRAATACSTSSRWPTWARCWPRRPPPPRCTAARRCGATSCPCSTPRAPTRASSSGASPRAGLMLFRAAKALAALDGPRPRAARRRAGAAPAGAHPPAAARARGGRRRARGGRARRARPGARRCERRRRP